MARFGAFSTVELRTLWDGLAMDDGLRYRPEPGRDAEAKLLAEVECEMRERGMDPPMAWGFTGKPEWTYS